MSETIDQASFDSSTSGVSESDGWNVDSGSAPATSLESILDRGAADVTAPDRGRRDDSAADRPGRERRDENSRIPISALRKERERREKIDRDIDRLKSELSRYEDQKAGIPTEDVAGDDGGSAISQERAAAYNKSCDAFVTRHGAERYSALEAAVNKLAPDQAAHVLSLVEQAGGDPVERVYGYVKKLGLLADAKRDRLSIQDILSGKKEDPRQASDSAPQLEEAITRAEAAEQRANFSTSRAEFVHTYGREQFQELNKAVDKWVAMGDPRVAEFAHIAKSHPDPVGLTAHVMQQFGLWSPPGEGSESSQKEPPAPRPVFPSNIAGARNVGARSGPVWSGPAPLQDIFNRSRA